MLQMIGRRASHALVLLALASVLCFSLVVVAPGNVAILVAELRTFGATKEDVRKVEEDLGLNLPLHQRYVAWLSKAATGDLGTSLRTNETVSDQLAQRLPVTAILVAGGGIVSVLLGFGLGLLGALWPSGLIDRLTRGAAMLGASVPTFFVGALLIYAFGVLLNWLPTFGFGGVSSWIMPWLTIGLVPAAVLSRVVRVSLEEAMARPFAITSASKGFGRRATLLRDAVPNAAPMFINTFGAQIALMVSGAVVVEPIFSWQGIGSYFIEAVRFRDFMIVQACLLIFAAFFIVANLVIDVAVMFVDPKLRRQGR